MVRGGGFHYNSATPTAREEPDGLFGPPPPLPKRKPAPKGGKQRGPKDQDVDKRRNYKRDWMPPAKKENKKKKDASTYLEHCYGE